LSEHVLNFYGYPAFNLRPWRFFWLISSLGNFETENLVLKLVWMIVDVPWFTAAVYFTHKWSREWNVRVSTRTSKSSK